jgi:8-oxo-dGTP pyrophosphatase MutT (NUDIX family)
MGSPGIFMTNLSIDKLRIRLQSGLPGREAQGIMAPTIRFQGEKFPDPVLSKPSGVLIILYPNNKEWYTVFIERTSFGLHGGQISLPGGKMEEYDFDLKATALREASEEVGVDKSKIEVLGELTPLHVPHSNFRITPVVGYLDEVPLLKRNVREVKSIIQLSLTDFFDKNRKGIEIFNKAGNKIYAPYYKANGHIVWGATAMIMSELEVLVK